MMRYGLVMVVVVYRICSSKSEEEFCSGKGEPRYEELRRCAGCVCV